MPNPQPSIGEGPEWVLQAAHAVAYVHTVPHRASFIAISVLAIYEELNIELCNFQGKSIYPDGTIRLDGESAEDIKPSMSRSDSNDANLKTDISGFGSGIYFIMEDHPPFPEQDSWKIRWGLL